MSSLKIYFKSKEFIFSLITIFILVIVSAINYFICMGNIELCYFPQWANRFAFWRYVLNYNAGGMIMFLSPFLISLLALTSFAFKLKGSYFKDVLLRQSYKKTILKELLFSYLKAYFPFFLISLLMFFLGSCLYQPDLLNTNIADPFTEFRYVGNFGPYIFFILWHFSFFLYTIMIVNIGYIILRITRRLTVSLILTFAAVNALNYIISSLGTILETLIGNNLLVEHLNLFNIYESYYIRSSITNAIIHTSIMVIITFIIVFFCYRKKEKVVRDFE